MTPAGMPIRSSLKGAHVMPVPWEIIAPHAHQALANHGQTLERLAERGGLDAVEAVAILEDRPYRAMDEADAFYRLAEIVRAYNQA